MALLHTFGAEGDDETHPGLTGIAGGSFRLTFDSTNTNCPDCQIKAKHTSTEIPFDATEEEVEAALQNMPNIGSVQVTRSPLALLPTMRTHGPSRSIPR